MEKVDMSCARVKQYQSSDIGSAERHNERKNDSYENINVVRERIPLNVHYRDTDGKSYMEMLRALENQGSKGATRARSTKGCSLQPKQTTQKSRG